MMDGSEFVEAVRTDKQTELSRLGSSKSLYADTRGEMDEATVLTAAADAFDAAADTFQRWAETESHEGAAEAFAEAADTERDHYDAVVEELDDYQPASAPALYGHLDGLEGTIERLGGFVGHAAVLDNKTDQLTGFFVGQASPGTSQLFRSVGEDVDAQRERGLELLEAACDSEDDWERAREAATEAVRVAYEEYFETLEDLGVNPKPVC